MKGPAIFAKLQAQLNEWVRELKTFDWNDIGDPESIGVWPGPVKALLVVTLFAGLLGGGYWFHIKNRQADLDRVIAAETGLRNDLESKAVLAANLEAYRAQMVEMNDSFGTLLSQLPGQTEVPGLLDDITFTGLGSGLQLNTIQLQREVAREFYIELPIDIAVTGNYHDFGAFVSGVASLSRIVTLHDFTINAAGSRDTSTMTILARTYRYNAGEAAR
jgi:type IV pilus assembly protein PilO